MRFLLWPTSGSCLSSFIESMFSRLVGLSGCFQLLLHIINHCETFHVFQGSSVVKGLFINYVCTVSIRLTNVSGNQMVVGSLVTEWSGNQVVRCSDHSVTRRNVR